MIRIVSIIMLLVYIGIEFFFTQGSHQFQIILLFTWFASISFVPKWKVGKLLLQKKYLYIYVFLLFYFLSTCYGSNIYKASTATLFFVRVFTPVLMYDILRNETDKIKHLFASVLMVYVLWYAFKSYNIIGLIGEESGLRGSARRREENIFIETMFAFVYILPVLVPTLIIIIRNKSMKTTRIKLSKAVLIFSAIYLFFLSLKSLYMTAIIITIIGTAIAFFYKQEESLNKLLYKSSITLLVVIIVFLMNYSGIIKLVENTGSRVALQRVEEVADILHGRYSRESDLGTRNNFRTVSFNTFLSNPIVGVNHKMIEKIDYGIIGNHAQWVDDLARYGIFALFMFLFIYKALLEQYKDTKMLLPILIYVVIGFLNPLLYTVSSYNIFVLVPLLIESLVADNNQNKTVLANNTK